ncbi:syntaxin 6, N-terminal-domain-containing protein [Pyronema omphalodes]|nr:syntaxin 6, N-terminal-domain-containing protein [Pyronema omphalodes]
MMSSTTDADPYIQFQSEVQSLLSSTRASFTNFLRLRSLSASPTELSAARHDLSENLSSLSDDLRDLGAAVKAVEKDPYKFGLDVSDVASRRRFVEESTGELEDMKEELASLDAEDSRPKYGGFVGDEDEDFGERGGHVIDASDPVSVFEHQQQQTIMREQEQQLEGVSRTVGNLREQAFVMGRELEEQQEMIESLDNDTERVQGKLGRGMRDLEKFIKANEDKASNWCIAFLILVLCILLFLLLVV